MGPIFQPNGEIVFQTFFFSGVVVVVVVFIIYLPSATQKFLFTSLSFTITCVHNTMRALLKNRENVYAYSMSIRLDVYRYVSHGLVIHSFHIKSVYFQQYTDSLFIGPIESFGHLFYGVFFVCKIVVGVLFSCIVSDTSYHFTIGCDAYVN